MHEDYRGHGLQKQMLLFQIESAGAKYFEGTVNPSNVASKRNYFELAQLLKTGCEENILLSAEDFEDDGHEPEILYRVGPISKTEIQTLVYTQLNT